MVLLWHPYDVTEGYERTQTRQLYLVKSPASRQRFNVQQGARVSGTMLRFKKGSGICFLPRVICQLVRSK